MGERAMVLCWCAPLHTALPSSDWELSELFPGLHFAIPLNPNVVPSIKFSPEARHPAHIAAFRKAASRYKACAHLPWALVHQSNRVSW